MQRLEDRLEHRVENFIDFYMIMHNNWIIINEITKMKLPNTAYMSVCVPIVKRGTFPHRYSGRMCTWTLYTIVNNDENVYNVVLIVIDCFHYDIPCVR